jgi:hypothetical protein
MGYMADAPFLALDHVQLAIPLDPKMPLAASTVIC